MDRVKDIMGKLEKLKYPILIALLGIAVLLFPTNTPKDADAAETESPLQTALSKTEGVGEVKVILSENGAVIVCDGAGNAKTRLDITTAVSTYTGFGADKITILKMAEQ